MVTRNYILPIGDTLTALHDEIVERIPCFTHIFNNEDGTVTLTVDCRAEDVGFVDRTLAPYLIF